MQNIVDPWNILQICIKKSKRWVKKKKKEDPVSVGEHDSPNHQQEIDVASSKKQPVDIYATIEANSRFSEKTDRLFAWICQWVN